MATDIEWADETWNPTVGCSRVDHRCDGCYAIGVAHRGLRPEHGGLTKLRPRGASRPGVDWTGVVRTLPDRLDVPLRWRKSRRVFVDSMSDLFHPGVPFQFVEQVFETMQAAGQHTFLVLTKRPSRAREFYEWSPWVAGMPNVHLGVSVSDQATWDADVPELLRCPAALHWVSCEPLLGPIDLCLGTKDRPHVEHVIVGGESGHRSRPNVLDWTRSIIAQCRRARVPVFHKQVGEHALDAAPHADEWPLGPAEWNVGRTLFRPTLSKRKGGEMADWPADLRVRELPEVRS
jgi:protein gp37